MSSRGNDGLVNTDNTDEILQTNLHTPERLRLQHGNNLPRTLTNRYAKKTVTPLRITDKGRSDTKLEKKMHTSVARREKHTICIKAHRNSVTSKMKHVILKGKFCYNKSVSFQI